MLADDIEIVTDLPKLPTRAADSNKGTFGRVLVVAGSRGMAGAGVLCASAALRAGAGLVRLAVPKELVPVAATANPCMMTMGLPQDATGRIAALTRRELANVTHGSDVVALGPGLGRGRALNHVVRSFLSGWDLPLVLDADGLNNIAGDADAFRGHVGPVVITPHPGEFARLLETDTATVQVNRRTLATQFAAQHGIVVVLKGHATLVTDGRRLFVNSTGNPGMATAGSGDVLTGIIAALIGQGLAPFAAAQLGVFWHGTAGDLAAAARTVGSDRLQAVGAGSHVSLIATDLIDYLPWISSVPHVKSV